MSLLLKQSLGRGKGALQVTPDQELLTWKSWDSYHHPPQGRGQVRRPDTQEQFLPDACGGRELEAQLCQRHLGVYPQQDCSSCPSLSPPSRWLGGPLLGGLDQDSSASTWLETRVALRELTKAMTGVALCHDTTQGS